MNSIASQDAAVSSKALDALFCQARTYSQFSDRPVGLDTLQQIYQHYRWAPTAMNCQPLRVVFLTSAQAKERLRPVLSPSYVDKTMAAPVVALLAFDSQFTEHMTALGSAETQAKLEALDTSKTQEMASFNASLQAGYFILAARALGLDCGPMAGFNKVATDAAFFADGRFKSILLVNLGYGIPEGTKPRAARLDFATACSVL